VTLYLLEKPAQICYAVQVGAFRDKGNARRYADRMRDRFNCDSRVVRRSGLYKVLLGRFSREAAAADFGTSLGVDYFVVGCD